ncbi:GSCOCG00009485001-RA-CDS [Cotesia congregata]|nr:GSCOCG00009485001-RA-CDS [Cotesia congregata]
MTSVDSGVETGNDSNDSSAQTENNQSNNQNFNDVTKTMTSVNTGNPDLDNQFVVTQNHQFVVTQNQKHRFESISINVGPQSTLTTTFLCQSEPLVSRNFVSPGINSSESLVSSQSSAPSLEKLQFRIPPDFMITPKSLRKDELNTNDSFVPYQEINRKYKKAGLFWTQKPRRLNSIYGASSGRKMRFAAATNNTELLTRLLEKGVSPNNHDDQGRSPLHLASCRGFTEIVKLLLDYGADPNQTDCIGNTPLHLAAVTSKISVVTLLLKAGTDVLSSDRHGYNPLQLAQTKLRMLQNCQGSDMNKVKDQVHKIVGMLLAYLQKQKDACEQIEALSSFCSRITLSNTSDQVQDDLKDLLINININCFLFLFDNIYYLLV